MRILLYSISHRNLLKWKMEGIRSIGTPTMTAARPQTYWHIALHYIAVVVAIAILILILYYLRDPAIRAVERLELLEAGSFRLSLFVALYTPYSTLYITVPCTREARPPGGGVLLLWSRGRWEERDAALLLWSFAVLVSLSSPSCHDDQQFCCRCRRVMAWPAISILSRK
jgi:hypothetical protein